VNELQKSIRVKCSVAHAFDTFTARIDLWWPPSHRRFPSSTLTLDAVVGGRFVEKSADGREAVLGEVVDVERPHRVKYTWAPGSPDAPTEVEVRFTADGDETVVDVRHTPGRSSVFSEKVALFEKGWSAVLPAFASAL
jgi:uncharacterized protein YndB with AHSA1/START domain